MHQCISKKLLLCFLLVATAFTARAEIIWKDMAYGVGMVNASFTENETGLTGDNIQEVSSGSVSSINGFINYKFKPNLQRSYYVNGTFPLLPGATGSYFGGTLGAEFYFGNRIGSKLSLYDQGSTLQMKPKSYFFWGGEVGLGYLIYLTETAKKTDILMTLGPMAGGVYKISEKWMIRYQAAYERGVGVSTTTSLMKFSLSLIFPFAD
jgi:hypothetical protein